MGQYVFVYAALFVLALFGCRHSNEESNAQRALPTGEPTVSQKMTTDDRLIIAGSNVGMLKLGYTREALLNILGNEREEYNHTDPCKYTEMHWYDVKADRNGIFVYLRNGRVYQIESDTPRFRTAEGITSDARPEDVRTHFPQLQAYVLVNSGSDVVGGRDLIYWVDQQSGIAFEFYYNRKERKRRVSKIIVFDPRSDFQQSGCVSPPQTLLKLEPFSLEAPNAKP